MALSAIRNYVSSSDQGTLARTADGHIILVDPNVYATSIASAVTNITFSGDSGMGIPAYPGGNPATVSNLVLNYTNDYPNDPPIYHIKAPWSAGTASYNSYERTSTLGTATQGAYTYYWKLTIDRLCLHVDSVSGTCFWYSHNYASVVNQYSTNFAGVTWYTKKLCTPTDTNKYGSYVIDGSPTWANANRSLILCSDWGITVNE